MGEFPKIPGYKIQKKIGEGATANIYYAIQSNLDREVAIKVFKPGFEDNSVYVRRFIKEARIVSKLYHPNIVTIHDVGKSGNFHYIVMEYLEESLRDKLNSHGRLPVKEVLRIFKPVARALKFAHSKKVVHRDIKPGNILFRKDGTPVIADFGLAKDMDAGTTLAEAGMILGTPAYMSPEQCKGERGDYLSDIYSLGVVLYAMLSGEVPYMSKDYRKILDVHINSPIPPLPRELRKFQPLIEWMMAKNKKERLHDLNEAVKQLKQLIYGDDVEITVESFPVSWERNIKIKQIWQVIALIILLLSLLVLLYFVKLKFLGTIDGNANSPISKNVRQQTDISAVGKNSRQETVANEV
ncbi:MAG: serine/threonine-protein kinase [Candidatus Aminicenantes bacterium]|nr:serine/threonine-protein kinase [Candidatus Aminicenantes bacterium]